MAIAVFTLLSSHALPKSLVKLSNNCSNLALSASVDLVSSCILLPRIDGNMSTTLVSDTRIKVIWDWCSDAYLQHGFKIKLPKARDIRKTYQWRFVKSIAEKFTEWNFDDDTAMRFIKIAVAQAKLRGVLKKGLAALHQTNMLNICYEILTNEKNENDNILSALAMQKRWFDNHIGDDPSATLLHRAGHGALPTLIIWYQASRISDHFILLSRSCYKALLMLQGDSMESRMLPSPTSLYLLRGTFFSDLNNVRVSQGIFGDDWRKL